MTSQAATLGIGERPERFTLPDPDGALHSLQTAESATVILFLSNHCPYVSSWEDRIKAIANDFASRGVKFYAVSSNDIDRYPKDGPSEMRKRAEEALYPFPYLFDEDGAVARSFGATRTPEAFVLDSSGALRYRGAIDSNWDEEETDRDEYLHDALDAVLAGKVISTSETPAVGCPIKTRA